MAPACFSDESSEDHHYSCQNLCNFEHVPSEICLYILQFLDINDLVNLMTVSRKLKILSKITLKTVTFLDIRNVSLLRHENVCGSLLEIGPRRDRPKFKRTLLKLTTLIPRLQGLHVRPALSSIDLPFILNTVASSGDWLANLTELTLTSHMRSISNGTWRSLASLVGLKKLTITGMIFEESEDVLEQTMQSLTHLNHVTCFIRIKNSHGCERYATDFVRSLPLQQLQHLSCPVDASTLMQIILDQALRSLESLSVRLVGVLNLNLATLVNKLPALKQLEIFFEGSNEGKVHDLNVLSQLKLSKMQVANAKLRKGSLRSTISMCKSLSLSKVRLSKRLCRHLLKLYNCYNARNGKPIHHCTVLNKETKYSKVNLVGCFEREFPEK